MEESPPLVFVVGAGASRDFGRGVRGGLPLGFELANQIRDSLNKEFGGDKPALDGPVSEALAKSPTGYTPAHKAAADRIRRSIHAKASIDDLLHEWRDQKEMIEVGKIAIANEILIGEAETALGRTQSEDTFLGIIGNLQQSWLGYFLTHLPQNNDHRNLLQILKRQVGFVIFNYDRCVERMIVGELVCTTTADFEQAHAYVKDMAIIHPYGYLGPESGKPPPLGVETRSLYEISQGIRTYTEENNDRKSLEKLKQILTKAKRVVFLGFGYHPTSMKLLIQHGLRPSQNIMGACERPDEKRMAQVRQALFPNDSTMKRLMHSVPANTFIQTNIAHILSDL